MSGGPPTAQITTVVLDQVAVIYAVCKAAGVPFDPHGFGLTAAEIEAHLREHGRRLAGVE